MDIRSPLIPVMLALALVVVAALITFSPGPAPSVPVTPVPTLRPDTPGTLTITTDPPGAEIWLDTDPGPSATTPAMLTLSPITHPVMLRLTGYRDYVTSVAVRPGENVTLAAAMEPEQQEPHLPA